MGKKNRNNQENKEMVYDDLLSREPEITTAIAHIEESVAEAAPEPELKPYKVTGALVNLRRGPGRVHKITKAVIIDDVVDISETVFNDDENCTYGFIPIENSWINMTYVKSI